MLSAIKKMDKKMLTMIGVVFGIIIIVIVAIIIVALSSGGKLSYPKIENKMISAAQKYYKDNDNLLPKKVGETVEIDAMVLTSDSYMKDLSEYTDESVICNGKVIVAKTDDDYDYVPSLDCGTDYKTEFLSEKLLENTTTSGEGLYKLEDVVKTGDPLEFDDEGYDLSSNELLKGYIYRGENVNNYIKLDGSLYRIVQIDGNNDITVITEYKKSKGPYDNRYNSDASQNYGINNYTVSRAYEGIKKMYDELDAKGTIKTKIATKNICVGARSVDDTSTDGSAECSTVMKDQHYGMITMANFMNASLSEDCENSLSAECRNYNYLAAVSSSYWTMTPSTENTYSAYRISNKIESLRTDKNAIYRFVFYLSNRLRYVSGSGTESDPYIVK